MFEKVLFEKIPAKLLILIDKKGKNQSINMLCRKNGISLSWGYKLVELFLGEGLITKDKVDGLSYRMSLIEKGKEILSHIKEIKERLK